MYHLLNLAAAAQPGAADGEFFTTLSGRLTPVIALLALVAGIVVSCVIWFSKEKRSVSKAADTAGSFVIGAVPLGVAVSVPLLIGLIAWGISYFTGN